MRGSFVLALVLMYAVGPRVHAQPPQSLPPATAPAPDALAPLYVQANELVYDTRSNRVVMQGSVEIYYSNYIVTADRVTYDQNANELVAEGSIQIKDPNGSVVRGDRFRLTDEFRDAFRTSLNHADRIAGDRSKP